MEVCLYSAEKAAHIPYSFADWLMIAQKAIAAGAFRFGAKTKFNLSPLPINNYHGSSSLIRKLSTGWSVRVCGHLRRNLLSHLRWYPILLHSHTGGRRGHHILSILARTSRIIRLRKNNTKVYRLLKLLLYCCRGLFMVPAVLELSNKFCKIDPDCCC